MDKSIGPFSPNELAWKKKPVTWPEILAGCMAASLCVALNRRDPILKSSCVPGQTGIIIMWHDLHKCY